MKKNNVRRNAILGNKIKKWLKEGVQPFGTSVLWTSTTVGMKE